MRYSDIFNENSVNIFTDGSIYNNMETGETIGCAGTLLVGNVSNGFGIINDDYTILRNTTNNETEITAIYIGVRMAIDYIKHTGYNPTFNLFSDSKICVLGLREWIYNWIRCMNNGIMYNSNGTPVKNQEIFKNIVQLILDNNLCIKLFHQKGHVTKSDASLRNAMDVFNVSNKLNVKDLSLISAISKYNNDVDSITKTLLTEAIRSGEFNIRHEKMINPYIMDLSNINTKKLKYLLTGGNA